MSLYQLGDEGEGLMLKFMEWSKIYKYAHVTRMGPLLQHCTVYHHDYVKAVMSRAVLSISYLQNNQNIQHWDTSSGDGLLTSAGPKWFRNRRLLTPGFHFEILKPYVRLFSESTNVMLNNWEELKSGSSIDVFHHTSLMTLDSMLKCALSQHTDCQTRKTNDYIAAVFELTDLTMKRARTLLLRSDLIYALSADGKRYRKACNMVHEYAKRIIAERREALNHEDATNKKKNIDFLDILLKARDEDGNGLTDAEIRDEVDTFMFEGHDTTASGLAWTLYCLARHPGHQEKCRKEAQEVLQGETEVTWNCIGQHFAMNELKTAVALILQRFSLTPDDTLPEPIPVPKLIMRAKKPGLFLKIKPITA
uniref:Uncharacterized protein n=1 Tax=Branchiostoma floridae TaxID=7739 RepID=C3XRR3_BRAFL|eukprot:XP_002613372.1 hypothetical protein BRAFLDRAFT_68358 [Branchiostoma floridae]